MRVVHCLPPHTLFSDTRDAAVQWAIMKPEFKPPSLTKNAGSSLRYGLTSLSILRSEMFASSWVYSRRTHQRPTLEH